MKYHGVVKFFNDITGYGFIRQIEDNNDAPNELYVQLNSIQPKLDTGMPKRLYTGEYVQFEFEAPNKAVNVTGAFDGPLLMEHGDIQFNSYSRAYLKSSVDINVGNHIPTADEFSNEGNFSS